MVGGRGFLLRRQEDASLDLLPPPHAHGSPPRAANHASALAQSSAAQHLWAYGGHGWVNAKLGSHHLRLSGFGNFAERGIRRPAQNTAARPWRAARDGAALTLPPPSEQVNPKIRTTDRDRAPRQNQFRNMGI